MKELDQERFETMKGYFDMVLAFAYGRATAQHKTKVQYAIKKSQR